MSRPFDVSVRDPGAAESSACRRCGESYPLASLDRWLWCPACRSGLERKARRGQHLVAALITLPFLIWILVRGTGSVLPLYAWVLPLMAAYYLGSRIGRVLIRNYLRAQRGAA